MSTLNQPDQVSRSLPAPVRANLYELYCREHATLPEDWAIYCMEQFPKTSGPCNYIQLTGAVAVVDRSGKRTWPNKELSRRVFQVSPADFAKFQAEWSKRTGYCITCLGTGEQWTGWNHLTGDRYERCSDCGGSGSANTKHEERDNGK